MNANGDPEITYPFPPNLVCTCGCSGGDHGLDWKQQTKCDKHGGHKFQRIPGLSVEPKEGTLDVS